MIKATMHKSCSCESCRTGRGTKRGQFTRRQNERKLRHATKRALRNINSATAEYIDGLDFGPISSPLTD